MNKIVYVLRPNIETLPPAMSQIVALTKLGYKIQLVSSTITSQTMSLFGTNVELSLLEETNKKKKNKIHKAIDIIRFRKLVKTVLNSNSDSIIWIGSADTAQYCKGLFASHPHKILNLYELYDQYPKILKSIRHIAQSSDAVVVPEYNRAHILKVWLNLKKAPLVIPNKPYFPETIIENETFALQQSISMLGKKVVLYQGWIGGDRDIVKVAEALNTIEQKNDYVLVLMGEIVPGYSIEAIRGKFENVVHIPYVRPPQHLFITETAYIGIATYDDSSLNNVFCAPNKIYEYAYKGVPILARDIPGLKNTVGKLGAGICVDFDNVEEIKNAILTISQNHDEFIRSAETLYNSCDIMYLIKSVLFQCGVEL